MNVGSDQLRDLIILSGTLGNRSFRLRVVSPTLNSPTCKVDSPTCLMYVIGQFAHGSYVRVVDVDLSCYHKK